MGSRPVSRQKMSFADQIYLLNHVDSKNCCKFAELRHYFFIRDSTNFLT